MTYGNNLQSSKMQNHVEISCNQAKCKNLSLIRDLSYNNKKPIWTVSYERLQQFAHDVIWT